MPEQPPQETLSLTYVIGITQFVFLALGLMVLSILVKVSPVAENVSPLAQFLTAHSLWLIILPLAWMFLASLLARWGTVGNLVAKALGFGLAVIIGVVFALAIMRPEF